jgi:hypothetical protein
MPISRIAPAQQHLGADDARRLDVHLGLPVQLELAARDGVAQLLLDDHAAAVAVAEVGRIRLVAAAAGLLGGVQRDVGVHQQVVGTHRMVDAARHADAGRGAQRAAVDVHRLLQHVEQAPRQRVDVGRPIGIGEHQQRELVAAQSRHQVVGTPAGEQARGHGLQQLVAGGVSQRVVDQLEVVEIQRQQRHEAAPRQRGAQRAVQREAIGQAGERVGVGQVAQALLRHHLLGGVGDRAAPARGVAVLVDQGACR